MNENETRYCPDCGRPLVGGKCTYCESISPGSKEEPNPAEPEITPEVEPQIEIELQENKTTQDTENVSAPQMNFCTDCGARLQNGVCPNCSKSVPPEDPIYKTPVNDNTSYNAPPSGYNYYQAPEPETYTDGIQAFKKIASSGLMLTAAIFSILYAAANFSFFSLALNVIFCVGLFLTWNAARKKDTPVMNTTGITMMQAIIVIQTVLTILTAILVIILAAIILIAAAAGDAAYNSDFYINAAALAIVGIVFLIIAIVAAAIYIIYMVNTFSTFSKAKKFAVKGRAPKGFSKAFGVITIVIGSLRILGGLSAVNAGSIVNNWYFNSLIEEIEDYMQIEIGNLLNNAISLGAFQSVMSGLAEGLLMIFGGIIFCQLAQRLNQYCSDRLGNQNGIR